MVFTYPIPNLATVEDRVLLMFRNILAVGMSLSSSSPLFLLRECLSVFLRDRDDVGGGWGEGDSERGRAARGHSAPWTSIIPLPPSPRTFPPH